MNCTEAHELIHDALDGTASAEATARLHEHLRACEECAREWDALAGVDDLLRRAHEEEPDAAYFEDMARALGLIEGEEVQARLEEFFNFMVERKLMLRGKIARDTVPGGTPFHYEE